MAVDAALGLLRAGHADARPDRVLVWPGRFQSEAIPGSELPGALKGLAAASQSAAILPLAEVEDAGHTDVQWRALSPPLRRPMALAYRAAPEPGAAAAAVLEALAAFSTA